VNVSTTLYIDVRTLHQRSGVIRIFWRDIDGSINQSIDETCIAPLQIWTAVLNDVKIKEGWCENGEILIKADDSER